jgi:hypothetical protein
VVDVEQPEFSMKLHNEGLGIYESNSRVLFRGASNDVSEDVYWLRWMSDLFIPPWAVAKVIASEGEFFSDLLCQQTMAYAIPDCRKAELTERSIRRS